MRKRHDIFYRLSNHDFTALKYAKLSLWEKTVKNLTHFGIYKIMIAEYVKCVQSLPNFISQADRARNVRWRNEIRNRQYIFWMLSNHAFVANKIC